MNRRRLIIAVLTSLMLLALLVGGTFAVFTDTESSHPKFKAGTINIALSGEAYTTTFLNPTGFDDWKPGDHEDFELNIKNIGSNKAWIQIYIYETPPWTDGRANFWDAAAWDVEHTGEWNKWVLSPGESMQVKLVVDFPQSAGNEFQGAQGDLAILVVGKQWRNKFNEYSCVALEDKDSDYIPILGNGLEGIVCYKEVDGKLLVDVNGYGLDDGEYYQLSLNGTGGGTNCDNFEDVSFAGMSGNLYLSGWYQYDGMVLHNSCGASWHEGVWNFTGTYGEVKADPSGAIAWSGELEGLPKGTYDHVKFMVKHITGYAAPAPDVGNEGNSWVPILMEMDYLSFIIP